MNNELRTILKELNIACQKITLKNTASIIKGTNKNYVIKKHTNSLSNIYNYLSSRAFDYYPKLLITKNNYDIFEYIDNLNIKGTEAEQAQDIIHLTALLHAKTTFYKELDIDDYKKLYEDILDNLNYLNNYYLDLITNIDKEIYMSPFNYLLDRNINMIFSSLDHSNYLLNKWYNLIKNKQKVRLVTIHNNLSLDHYLRNSKSYLLSWGKSKIDMPIYDLLFFYQKYALSFDFISLFQHYESVYPLLEDEKALLFSLMLIPNKILLDKDEYSKCKELRLQIDYLYKTSKLIENLSPPPKKGTKDKKN